VFGFCLELGIIIHLTQSTSEPQITQITQITPIFLGVNSSWTIHGVNHGAQVGLIGVIGVIGVIGGSNLEGGA
jgi:hypothetical protein